MNFKLNLAKVAALSVVAAAVAAPPLLADQQVTGRAVRPGSTASPTLVEQNGAVNEAVPVDDANSGADAPASPAHSVPGTDIASGDNGTAPEAAASMGAGGVMSAPAMQGPLPGAGANPRAPSGKGGAVRAGQEGAIRQN